MVAQNLTDRQKFAPLGRGCFLTFGPRARDSPADRIGTLLYPYRQTQQRNSFTRCPLGTSAGQVMRKTYSRLPLGLLDPLRVALAVLLSAGGVAGAEQLCDDPANLPAPLYLTVGDTQVNLMKELGQKLREKESRTLIWRATGSCTNLDTIYSGSKLSGNFSYIPAGYDPVATPTPPTCSVPPPGVTADVANAIVFLDGCAATRPDTIADKDAAFGRSAFTHLVQHVALSITCAPQRQDDLVCQRVTDLVP